MQPRFEVGAADPPFPAHPQAPQFPAAQQPLDGGGGDVEQRKIGAIAKPANIVFTPELPKTRSGKIMRRLLRDVAENRPLGDTTTLADPAVVTELKERADSEKSEE